MQLTQGGVPGASLHLQHLQDRPAKVHQEKHIICLLTGVNDVRAAGTLQAICMLAATQYACIAHMQLAELAAFESSCFSIE